MSFWKIPTIANIKLSVFETSIISPLTIPKHLLTLPPSFFLLSTQRWLPVFVVLSPFVFDVYNYTRVWDVLEKCFEHHSQSMLDFSSSLQTFPNNFCLTQALFQHFNFYSHRKKHQCFFIFTVSEIRKQTWRESGYWESVRILFFCQVFTMSFRMKYFTLHGHSLILTNSFPEKIWDVNIYFWEFIEPILLLFRNWKALNCILHCCQLQLHKLRRCWHCYGEIESCRIFLIIICTILQSYPYTTSAMT